MEQKDQKPKKEPLKNYVKYSGLAFQMMIIIALGALVGIKLDEYFEVKGHFFTIFVLLFSVIASIYYVIRGLLK